MRKVTASLLLTISLSPWFVSAFQINTKRKSAYNLFSTESSSCPFTRYYPRYRIDLSKVPNKKTGWLELSFMKDWRQQKQKEIISKKLPQTNIRWHEAKDGVSAMATLWRTAYEVSNGSIQDVAVVFLNTQDRFPRHWLDIFRWMKEQNIDPSVSKMEVTYDDTTELAPLVRFLSLSTKTQTTKNDNTYEAARIINKRTEAWVRRILVDLGICPFTKSSKMAGQGLGDVGIPVGSIAYHASTETGICGVLADTWEAIQDMIERGPEGRAGVSSILLAAPSFDERFDLWSGPLFCILETCIVAANAEAQLGVVCFHPRYATPDGTSWPGFGHMHSVPRLEKWVREEDPSCPFSLEEIAAGGAWQRRTPHATINVLRADQLAAAEGARNSAKLYPNNIRKLLNIGNERLQEGLNEERNLL